MLQTPGFRGLRMERDAAPGAVRILKAPGALGPDGAPGSGQRRVAAEVYEASQRARHILEAAESDAQRIREAAEADRERLWAEAAASGHQEGLARASAAIALGALERQRLLASAKKELLRLAVAVAEKILRREVARDDEVAVEMAARALAEARQRREVTLRIHPADAEAVRRSHERLLSALSRTRVLELREDPAVAPGGALVETEAGIIDARLETQLGAIAAALQEGGAS